jgi:uncharacterized protein (DUF885 family)
MLQSKKREREMKTLFRWGFRLFLLLILAVVLFGLHTWYFRPVTIGIFFEKTFMQYGFDSPQLLSSIRMLPSWMDWYSDDLDDASPAQADRLNARLRKDLETLRSYDRNSLSATDKESAEILEQFMSVQVEGQKYQYHDYPLNQLFGVQSSLPSFMASQHPVKTVEDGDDYLSRLNQVPRFVDQVMEGLVLRDQKGITPPTFVVEKVLKEMREFVAAPADKNILYSSLKEKLDKADANSISKQEQARLLASTKTAIEQQVYPAYQKFIKHYEAIQSKTKGNNGVWALPDGENFYRWCVKMHTTTEMTPDQVHELGLSEVARIEAEMNAILVAEGLAEGTIGARVQQISQRPDQLYPDTDAGRAQILKDYQIIIDEIDKGMPQAFDLRPKASVKVERIPEFKEKTSPGAYYEPAAFDGSRPGVFFANLRDVNETKRFGMRTLAYHEAVPGHHFQIAIQQSNQGVPTFRKLVPFTAYAEGWALYSERLAWELGYQDKPLDNLGRLQAEMFRAVRLVVDTGMHHKRWTREQAITYMMEKTGMPEGEVTAEIERYLVMPGQALAYKVGMNSILQAREKAKQELGDKFDLKRFHNQVLGAGSMPLSVLQARVDRWIATEKSK